MVEYGGLRAHRTALPFFLGLIVGDAVKVLIAAVLIEVFGGGGAWQPLA